MSGSALSGRDFLQIRDAAKLLGVSEKTLRNWDRAGHLRARRHPVNGYRIYHVAELRGFLDRFETGDDIADFDDPSLPEIPGTLPFDDTLEAAPAPLPMLPPCHWSPEVALDPKHRPQRWDRPSSTVRRDWRKFPQEAHVIDPTERKYRRLTVSEIAAIQGFDPGVVDDPELTDREKIASIGDAVPPALAAAVFTGLGRLWSPAVPTALEICAGIGGLAEGASAFGLDHVALLDSSSVCVRLLRRGRHWRADRVHHTDVREHDFSQYRGRIGLLSGGPPCQPWSQSGLHLGAADSRDLLGHTPEIVRAVAPEAFVFENVPGLAMFDDGTYLRDLVNRLRRPSADLTYGVVAAVLNAADFGVPQIRRRIFIAGLRNRPSADAYRSFDVVASLMTHRDPQISSSARHWVTVGEVCETFPDPGGWRRWIGGGLA